MRFPEKRKLIMRRSMALGHCVCNPKKPCPCDTLLEKNLCPCAGERPDPPREAVRLTRFVRKAGCASKIGQADLKRVLKDLPVFDDPNVLVGFPAGDDAGIYRLEGDNNLVQTVDVFSPVVDDPYMFGQISAANSVSDIYAMGGKPICALSIIGFPIEELPGEVMSAILRGGLETMHEAGVSVIGGHSINDEEIKCGFAVTGLISGTGSVTNAGARTGDLIVLTKPIGTGLISFASQIGMASEEASALIAKSMAELNKDAAELMLENGADACTDVTGFSLLGHLSEMACRSGATARIFMKDVPVFAEALACVEAEIIPGAVERNKECFIDRVALEGPARLESLVDIFYDAQTSGGLLVTLPPEPAEAFVQSMKDKGHEFTSIIGEVIERADSDVQVILERPEAMVGEYRPKSKEDIRNAMKEVPESTEDICCCGGGESEPLESSNYEPASTVEQLGEDKETLMSEESQTQEQYVKFMKSVNAPGELNAKTKRMLAIALSISERCTPCLKIHLTAAIHEGISVEAIDEAAWVAISFCGAPAKMFYEDMKKRLEMA